MAKKKKIRTLEEVCKKEDFRKEICGTKYCSIGLDKKIHCEYQAKVPDHNGLYACWRYLDRLN